MKLTVTKDDLLFRLPELAAEVSDGKKYDLELKPHRERRSLDANAYFWKLLDELSSVLGKPKTEIYREYIRNIGGVSDTVCVKDRAVEKLRESWSRNGIGWQTDIFPSKIEGCTNVVLYYGSSTYDSRQMSQLIDLLIFDCKDQGIETMTPAEIEDLKRCYEHSAERSCG